MQQKKCEPQKPALFIFIEAQLHHLPPCWRELVARAYYCATSPLLKGGRGDVYSHWQIALTNKTFQAASFIFIEARLHHFFPLGQGDVYSHCRGDWQIALTKQNLSDNLFLFL